MFTDYLKLGVPLEIFLNVVQLICLGFYQVWWFTTLGAVLFLLFCIMVDQTCINGRSMMEYVPSWSCLCFCFRRRRSSSSTNTNDPKQDSKSMLNQRLMNQETNGYDGANGQRENSSTLEEDPSVSTGVVGRRLETVHEGSKDDHYDGEETVAASFVFGQATSAKMVEQKKMVNGSNNNHDDHSMDDTDDNHQLSMV